MDSEQEHLVAVHEAAHAVVRYWVGKQIGSAYGHTQTSLDTDPPCMKFRLTTIRLDRRTDPRARRRVEVDVMTLLAGPLAAQKAGSDKDGGRQDRDKAAGFAELHSRSNEAGVKRYLQLMTERTQKVLDSPEVWDAIQALAAELLERRTITWSRFKSIVQLQPCKVTP